MDGSNVHRRADSLALIAREDMIQSTHTCISGSERSDNRGYLGRLKSEALMKRETGSDLL
jgi:hypothetical protein